MLREMLRQIERLTNNASVHSVLDAKQLIRQIGAKVKSALVEHDVDVSRREALVASVQSALGTEETGDALVEVARAAHRAEQRARVWVVMGNDFPDAVFDTEEGARSHVEWMKENEIADPPRIH